MRRAPRGVGKLLATTKMGIKVIAFLLCTVILPIGRELVSEHMIQLPEKWAFGIEALQRRFGLVVPIHARVLLARAADALDPVHRTALFSQAGEHQVDGLHPHGHGLVHLPLILVDAYALLDTVFRGEVGVEVDFGFGYDRQVG